MRIAWPILFVVALGGLKATAAEPAAKLWGVSVASLVAANAADIHFSWGKRELNPVLASQSDVFGRDAALVKAGIVGVVIGAEYLVTRHKPNSRLYRALTYINFGGAAVNGALAFHNSTVPRAVPR